MAAEAMNSAGLAEKFIAEEKKLATELMLEVFTGFIIFRYILKS